MATLTEPRADLATEDHTRLQGTWQFLGGRRPAEVVFEGDRFTVTFRDGDVYRGTFRIDPAQQPRAIDMNVEEGPERHVGLTSLGIYRLEGATLRWSPGEPGRGRPRTFPSDPESRQLDLFFKHGGPAAGST